MVTVGCLTSTVSFANVLPPKKLDGFTLYSTTAANPDEYQLTFTGTVVYEPIMGYNCFLMVVGDYSDCQDLLIQTYNIPDWSYAFETLFNHTWNHHYGKTGALGSTQSVVVSYSDTQGATLGATEDWIYSPGNYHNKRVLSWRTSSGLELAD